MRGARARAARARDELGLVEPIAVPPLGEVGAVRQRAVRGRGHGELEGQRALLGGLSDTAPRRQRRRGIVEERVERLPTKRGGKHPLRVLAARSVQAGEVGNTAPTAGGGRGSDGAVGLRVALERLVEVRGGRDGVEGRGG